MTLPVGGVLATAEAFPNVMLASQCRGIVVKLKKKKCSKLSRRNFPACFG